MLCVYLKISHINFRIPEQIFMKLGMYVIAPESISTAYFINSSNQSVCLHVSSCRCKVTAR
jgi:hypothetical protein